MFKDRADIQSYLHHLPKRNNKFQQAVFGGIKKYIQFTFENTCHFMHKDNANKGLFRDWKQETSVFHFLDNWTNIVVSIAAFGTITIIPIQTQTQTVTKIQNTCVKPRYPDPWHHHDQFLIFPLPGELVMIIIIIITIIIVMDMGDIDGQAAVL